MKILLIVPTHAYKGQYPSFLSFSDFPSGFGYLAASLKKAGHEVIGLNLNNITGYKSATQMLVSEIDKAIQKQHPDLIGTGGICTDYHCLRDIIRTAREFAPKTPIVLGGGIVTNDAEWIMNNLKPDYAVMGEGEEVIVSIANGCEKKGIIPINQGIYQPLDERPFPDYEPFGIKDMLDNYSLATRVLYRYPKPYPRPYNIVASRSCPFTCTFCIHGHRQIKYRARSIENIMAEIKESYEKYHFNVLILLDELFAVSKDRLADFSRAVLQGKRDYGWDFDWCFQTHASARFTKETLELARSAGCYLFSYGIESASPTVLRSMQKKSKVEQISEAVRLATEAGIQFSGNLIFGDPAETEETIRESLYFWFEHSRDMMIFLAYVVPYPGSKIFDDCMKRGIIKDKQTYYELLKSVPLFNMTQIPNIILQGYYSFMDFLGKSWLWVKATDATKVELDDYTNKFLAYTNTQLYKVFAICPHCQKEIIFYQPFQDLKHDSFTGIGCTHCGRKVRINIGKNIC